MAALEKIYLYPSDRADEEYEAEWGDRPWGEDCVEYTRADVIVEKAIGWIDYNNRNGGCFFEGWENDFKKYVEGEINKRN